MTAQPIRAPLPLVPVDPRAVVLPPECLPPPEPCHDDVLEAVCLAWGVRLADVRKSRHGTKRVSEAKHACVVALHRLRPSMSLSELAKAVGLDHHTSALYHLRKAGIA